MGKISLKGLLERRINLEGRAKYMGGLSIKRIQPIIEDARQEFLEVIKDARENGDYKTIIETYQKWFSGEKID